MHKQLKLLTFHSYWSAVRALRFLSILTKVIELCIAYCMSRYLCPVKCLRKWSGIIGGGGVVKSVDEILFSRKFERKYLCAIWWQLYVFPSLFPWSKDFFSKTFTPYIFDWSLSKPIWLYLNWLSFRFKADTFGW